MNIKKLFKIILGFFIAVFFIVLINNQINADELYKAFSNTNYIWLICSVAIFILGYACRIERWRQMLLSENSSLTWSQCADPFLTSVAVNNCLPLRAGDALRAFGFNKRLQVSSGITVTTLVVERLLDLLMLLFFFGISINVFEIDSALLLHSSSFALILCALFILSILLFPKPYIPVIHFFCRHLSRISPKFGTTIASEADKGIQILIQLTGGRTMLKLVSLSLLAWLAEGTVFWLVAISIPTITHQLASWLALSVGTLSTLIPSTPGYVGTFDYFTIKTMTLLGNTSTSATAFTILVHTILWLPPTVIGGLFILRRSFKKFI